MTNNVEPVEIALSCPLSIDAAPAGDRKGPRRFTMNAYNGGEVRVNHYPLPVVIDIRGLSLIREHVPVYLGHTPERIVGHTDQHDKTDGTRFLTAGAISGATEFARQVLESHDAGFPWQASISAMPEVEALEHVAEGQTARVNGRTVRGPAIIARKSTLRHIAFVPEGADVTSSVSIAASAAQRGEANMPNDSNPTNQNAGNPPEEMRFEWEHAGLSDAERTELRLSAFRRDHGDVLPDFGHGMVRAVQTGALTWGDAEREILRGEVRAMKLREIRAERPQAPAIHASRRDTAPAVIECAFAQKLGVRNLDRHFRGDVLDAASRPEHRDVALGELLIEAAAANGYRGKPRITATNLKEVLGYAMPPAPIQASHSTLSLPGILSNIANKILLEGFNQVPQRWREMATVKSVSDFKTHTFYRLTTDLEYKQIGPTGEMEHGTPGDESYTGQARTYARMLGLTRTDIINDDLGAFDDLRTRIGMGGAIALNRLFWTTWLAAANAGTFWTAARGNLVTDQLLDDDGLAAALKAFRLAQAPDGNLLDLEPDRLLTGPTLEAAARRFYSAVEIRNPAASKRDPIANIWTSRFAPVIASQIENSAYTGYSDSTWWLAADPALLASAAVLFLDGRQEPVIESADADFNQLGIQFRGYHDFGVVMSEYRASVMVTAPAE